ncbi:DUF1800 family protein [Corallincola spongiicola]|uniref:DUF1800 family protein n=1 Tax=Corallincola spongiicola TaxID=2520508 RepID=A0ABY1WT99_9GAMM|nr:DUF1800 family protein [Corallincola spongiicola]
MPVTVSISTLTAEAYEQSNDIAKFIVERDSTNGSFALPYLVAGSSDQTEGSASAADYELVYSDGGVVGAEIEFLQSQNRRVIEVLPLRDGLHEVPETLSITLVASEEYKLGANKTAEIVISDAKNTTENAKVFIGLFGPQGEAVTTASGTVSLILQGDNTKAKLSYNFFNLSSVQTDQHIHLSPSGTMIKDIETLGPLTGFEWDLVPGGIFVTRQEMLDALFAGELFLNIHTSNYPAGEISAHFRYDESVEPPEEMELTPEDVDRDIIRFLTQATFGATPAEYEALRSQIDSAGTNRLQVYDAWIEAQMMAPQTSLLALTDASNSAFETRGFEDRQDGFWTIATYAKDQLRQRMAFALSEILVVSDSVNILRNAHRGLADYWDLLGQNAFGSYRDLLEDASRHATMGQWLSHLRNKKADPASGYYPDENYAREVMQLFSFGLVQRQKNGAIRLGSDGLPVATYDNEVIQQMARVFTGLAMSARNIDGEMVDNTQFGLGGGGVPETQYRWTEPMKFFPQHHDFGEKILFTDQGKTLIIPASSDMSAEGADEELSSVITALASHSSAAPYIGRILIQRLVTSNPSAGYIKRVSDAYGTSGNLKAMVKAILLDPEARNPSVTASSTFGKVKEPILRATALMRLLTAHSSIPLDDSENGLNYEFADRFDAGATILRVGNFDIGQRALGAPTVFNFFLPDYSPAGELAANSLTAPELELMTESRQFATLNAFDKLIGNGLVRGTVDDSGSYTLDQARVKLDISHLEMLWEGSDGDDEVKAEAVVDYLDFYLNAGAFAVLDSETKSIIVSTLADARESKRFNLAVYGMVNAPEVLVQK